MTLIGFVDEMNLAFERAKLELAPILVVSVLV